MRKLHKTVLTILGVSIVGASGIAVADMATTGGDTMTTSETKSPAAVGKAFLDGNAKKPGVVALPTGLQYKVLVEGKGKKPSSTDTVVVNYAGRLIDGTEFDSSYKSGQPATFPVNAVIPGWVEALQLMPQGSTWELYIPSSLAYGSAGAPPIIGPNETLIFKVELLEVK